MTVGRLLAAAAPLTLLKAGVVAMADVDAVFILGDFFEERNAVFDAATPPPACRGCRSPTSETPRPTKATSSWPASSRPSAARRPSLAMFAVAQAFNPLYLVVESLPGTVPPAVVLVIVEAWHRRVHRPALQSR